MRAEKTHLGCGICPRIGKNIYGVKMISEADREKILALALNYGVKRVLLFGSCLSEDGEARDIDLAVDGLAPDLFYNFYGDLLCSLSKPVDLVDLAGDSKFIRMINQEGMHLYG